MKKMTFNPIKNELPILSRLIDKILDYIFKDFDEIEFTVDEQKFQIQNKHEKGIINIEAMKATSKKRTSVGLYIKDAEASIMNPRDVIGGRLFKFINNEIGG